MRIDRLPLALLVLLLVSPVLAQDEDSEWEEWVASVAGKVTFTEPEMQAFKSDAKSYMVTRAIHGEEDGKGAWFAVRTLTKFPDTTRLQVSLVFHGQQLPWSEAEVSGGVAVCVLGPYGKKRVLAGDYAVQVAFFPHRQRQKVLDFPGVPVDEVRVETTVQVGDEARLAAELAERRAYYEDYMKRIMVLEAEQKKNFDAAEKREKFVLGHDEVTFDVAAWRRWVTDWRDRMQNQIGEAMREEVSRDLLAMRFHEAYTIVQSCVEWNLMASRAYSRLIYQTHGRAVHPDDEAGVDDVGLPTIQGKLQELHTRFAEFPWR